MTAKQSILGRIAQLTKANVNALLDRAEDPQKMLDQLVRDYTNNIAEAEQAIAQTIGNLRLAEQDFNEDVAAAREWGGKALAASRRADEYRAAGDTANADKFDQLAKVALRKQLDAESEVKQAQPMIESQRQTAEKLKTGLAAMKDKLGELKSRRDSLVARQKSAQAQQTVQTAISSINVLDPTSELGRFEETVRREEAKAIGQAEIAASSLDAQFEELTKADDEIELEARLAALKSGSTPPAQISPTSVTPDAGAF
ncbi:PspA/IM30 family protein [Xylanimonas ulmi]|uniref:Phage shock protein A (PspA) family protein n=1 Tax=Xylanimonas ulmi TaxID=228973 RepID=A0A4V2EY82_9MICO|nr:PspA/IM30 family protein [Xylanibacterium ulmi]RZS62080.1 phage shock protein A (PspA) family protein [Xylanibacterium ulmi]